MSDQQLIESLKLGNPQGLSSIYKLYRSEFIGWICRDYNCTTEEAKDIYQTSILILYKNIVDGKFAATSSIKTYLFGIGRNQFLKSKKEEQRFSNNIIDNVMDDFSEERELKELHEANLERVHNSLQALGDPCKKLLELSFFYKNSLETITTMLGYKNTDTTKNLKYKCLQRLKNIIQNESVIALKTTVS
jgi:RNA polymerase sigma factor (sigma-70 family)